MWVFTHIFTLIDEIVDITNDNVMAPFFFLPRSRFLGIRVPTIAWCAVEKHWVPLFSPFVPVLDRELGEGHKGALTHIY